jgi:hypothetical protein
MKFAHFTAPDGLVVAISTGGDSMILRQAHKVADPDRANTVIDTVCGEVKVRETMAEVEDKLK